MTTTTDATATAGPRTFILYESYWDPRVGLEGATEILLGFSVDDPDVTITDAYFWGSQFKKHLPSLETLINDITLIYEGEDDPAWNIDLFLLQNASPENVFTMLLEEHSGDYCGLQCFLTEVKLYPTAPVLEPVPVLRNEWALRCEGSLD